MGLLDSVEVGKGGDVAPRGSGAQHFLIPIDLKAMGASASDVLTEFTPGFAGKIISVDAYTVIVGAGAGATVVVSLEIGTTGLTGGAVTVDLAATNTVGEKATGTAVTANNEFGRGDTISILSAAGTTFTSGMIFLDIAYIVLAV